MNILLAGASGYVGTLIRSRFASQWRITGTSSRIDESGDNIQCNLSAADEVAELSRRIQPDIIIHAAGDKNLARCEATPRDAYAANVQTTLNLISAFPDTPIVYISSDYVFAGDRGGYREDDPVSPQTIYGRTKACADLAGLTLSGNFIVLRLSAVYDRNATFLRFLRESLSQGKAVDCYTDAFYSPTYSGDFLNLLQKLAEHPKHTRRIYHACGQRISRYFFARLFARAYGYDESLVRQASRAAENMQFLFSDMSLDNTITREALDVTATSHKEALALLAQSE